ncbi:hypothetical protein KFL_002310130 [Klebsormidium nitens]|uniref:BTB domain-containing protein n=1 Tax=Klebsormidium nitens TaxID=105231 RepID=A0A1Y1I9G9_KLENI|nr:hypothetical protein KFL_002310130 [Klebsormidium nitens]|eukprot:GAQ85357.1 hypothetical protein KFL_002310130 [Klebsormidium nitens]
MAEENSAAEALESMHISHPGTDNAGAAGQEKEKELNQATFFHCVEAQNAKTLQILTRTRQVDVNAVNQEGLTGLHIAVSQYDKTRNTDIVKILLEVGADINKKAADKAADKFLNIVRVSDSKHGKEETAKIKVNGMTPLLLALELKSSLYVKGMEYRHWDAMLSVLAAATIKQASNADVHAATQEAEHTASLAALQQGWAAVFDSGAHELVDLRAEGKDIPALKQIVMHSSKRWKREIESQDSTARSSLTRGGLLLEVKEASYTVIQHLVRYLYSGLGDDEFVKTRGADVFLAAYRYEIPDVCQVLEKKLDITPDNWIKVLSVAIVAGSSLLTLRVAQSIKHLLDKRLSFSHIRRPSFSYMELPPHQPFGKAENESAENLRKIEESSRD